VPDISAVILEATDTMIDLVGHIPREGLAALAGGPGERQVRGGDHWPGSL